MKLVPYNRLNEKYFDANSRPQKRMWREAIENGQIGGKIIFGKVYVDMDDFINRDEFTEGLPVVDSITLEQKAQALLT